MHSHFWFISFVGQVTNAQDGTRRYILRDYTVKISEEKIWRITREQHDQSGKKNLLVRFYDDKITFCSLREDRAVPVRQRRAATRRSAIRCRRYGWYLYTHENCHSLTCNKIKYVLFFSLEEFFMLDAAEVLSIRLHRTFMSYVSIQITVIS